MKTNLKFNRRQHHTGRRLLGTLAVAGAAAILSTFLLATGGHAASEEPSIPHGVSLASWAENGQGGQYVLQMLNGNAPPAGVKVSGAVVSDTSCKPDNQGFNHCHNVIKLTDGSRITVINTHVMKRFRCLAPGDRVSLTRINASWVVARLPQE